MADTFTTNYNWTKPQVGASADSWGTKLNADLDAIDTTVFGMQPKAGVLTSLSALSATINTFPYYTGTGAALANGAFGAGLSFSGGGVLSANVASVAGRTGAVTLSHSDISGLGSAALSIASDSAAVVAGVSSAAAGNFASFVSGSGTIQNSGYGPSSFVTVSAAGACAFLNVGSGLSGGGGSLSANVTSVAGRTGAVSLSSSDISGIGSMATRNVTIQSGGAPSGGASGDIFLIY
jgi:hypothetical protein